MRSVLLTLMVSLTLVQLSSLCPASCIICSEEAIICNKLSSIIEAPDSAKALLLTDGLIDTVSSFLFSNSSNMSILAFSNNIISTIMTDAFQNLTVLRTLILDHNRISNHNLDTSTFSWLRKLETLHLGNNALRDIDGSWFKSTSALKTLLLEGNLLTSLNSSTFASSDLRNLEVLDLSDNLITFLGRDSFRKLPRLRSLDLSRNRLQTAPDAFSYLSWLSMLNLDLNRWNCTCELKELSSFLNSYIQSPDKVLFNGQKLTCTSSDNPAVQTVLELTDDNCVPANTNITVTVVAKSSIKPQRYIRDVVIAAVCSFLGGVGITLGVFAFVYRKLGKKCRCLQENNEAEERSSPASAQWDISEDKEALSMAYSLHNSNYRDHQTWNKETSYDLQSDTAENHFICNNCSSTTLGTGSPDSGRRRESILQRTNHTRVQQKREDDWSTHVESDQWRETEGHSVLQSRIKDIRAQRRHEKGVSTNQHLRGDNVPQYGDISAIRMRQLALRRHISVAQRQTFTPKEQKNGDLHENHINNHSMLKPQFPALPVFQTINCLHCHQTYEYRQAGHENQANMLRSPSMSVIPSHENISEAILYRDSFNYNQSREGQAKEQRSVTFDLSKSTEQALILPRKEDEGPQIKRKTKTPTMQDLKNPKTGKVLTKINTNKRRYSKIHKPGSQVSRKLKVKLNLNPLRRNRVHSSNEDNDGDQWTSMKSKKAGQKRIKDKNSDSKQKSRKDKTSKKSSRSKTTKGSKHSNKHDGEMVSTEEDSKLTLSKNPPKDNDQELNEDKSKDSDTNVPTAGLIQDFETPNSAPLSNNIDLSTPSIQPVNQMTPTDPQIQATNPDLKPPMDTLGDINVPQEVSTDPQEVEDNTTLPVVQEYLSSGDGSPKRRIRLIIPEKNSNRPQTALDKKIR